MGNTSLVWVRLWRWRALAFLVVLLVSCAALPALDGNDIIAMKGSDVGEDVIRNMVAQSGGVVLTPEQESRLRGAGASETLMSFIRSNPPKSAPAIVSEPLPARTQSSARMIATEPEPVVPLPVTELEALPARYDKEGWLSVSNTDSTHYFLNIDVGAKRMFISRIPNGGCELPPGSGRAFNLRKETYKLYGDSGRDLKIRIRENEVTRLSLVPFGVVGNSGLTGVARDRERVRSEALFDNYVPPPAVIVHPVPTVVVPAPYPYYRYSPYPYYRGRGGYSFGVGW